MEEATWKGMYETVPPFLTPEQRKKWVAELKGVALSSDAFFPFRDNVDRASQVYPSVNNLILLMCKNLI